MAHKLSSSEPPKYTRRKSIFILTGFQLRYTGLVLGSLLVLLLFTGFHAFFVAEMALDPEVYANFKGVLQSSTVRLFLVGAIYIAVFTLAAIFLSHRAVGPVHRVEEQIRDMVSNETDIQSLHIREGDEFESLIESINLLIDKQSGKIKKK